MELKIHITKKNKNKVFKVIEELLEEEETNTTQNFQIGDEDKKTTITSSNLMNNPEGLENLPEGKILQYEEDIRPQTVGFWAQTNSLFSIMASVRILGNLMMQSKGKPIILNDFILTCKEIFEHGYRNYRGFPSTEKESAIGRFVWHFVTPAHEIGLIIITEFASNYEGIPWSNKDWKKVRICLSKQGYDLARIHSTFFDERQEEQILNKEERNWWLNYLKDIDAKGFKEYSLLKQVYDFLKKGHDGKGQLFDWFENNQDFIRYVKSWSRKSRKGDEESFKKQIRNVAISFAGSKVALLRELGVIINKRNDYTIIGEI